MRSVTDLLDLSGRVALVVGGAGHVGEAAATALAQVGAHVVVADLDEERAAAVADRVGAATLGSLSAQGVDLLDDEATQAVPQDVAHVWERLDIVVHSAALVGTSELPGWGGPLAAQSADTWRRAMDVNLTSAFSLAQGAAPALARSGNGSLILVSSIHGRVGPDPSLYVGTSMSTPAAYFASKGGLLQLMRWLSVEMAPAVRVNAISPGGVEREQPASFQERYAARTPLGRLATEEDLQGAFAYLASDLSRYVTGHDLVVDGGYTVG